jgi:hypothetical protein
MSHLIQYEELLKILNDVGGHYEHVVQSPYDDTPLHSNTETNFSCTFIWDSPDILSGFSIKADDMGILRVDPGKLNIKNRPDILYQKECVTHHLMQECLLKRHIKQSLEGKILVYKSPRPVYRPVRILQQKLRKIVGRHINISNTSNFPSSIEDDFDPRFHSSRRCFWEAFVSPNRLKEALEKPFSGTATNTQGFVWKDITRLIYHESNSNVLTVSDATQGSKTGFCLTIPWERILYANVLDKVIKSESLVVPKDYHKKGSLYYYKTLKGRVHCPLHNIDMSSS